LFLSTITVTFNRKETLEKAIRSLFLQDYPQSMYEIIVIDDGSTDGTEGLIEKLNAVHPIRYFRQEHKTIAAARNLGVKNSRGEVICFLDDDCIAPNSWLSSIAKLYRLHPEVDSVGGYWEHKFSRQNVPFALAKLLSYDGRPAKEGYINCLATRNLSYKKEVFGRNGFFNEELAYHEDREFNIRVTSGGQKIYFSPGLVITHIHPFALVSHYKREFLSGKISYRLYLRWGELFVSGFRLPVTPRDAVIFWSVPFLKPGMVLKEYGFSLKNIIYAPFLFLKYFIHRWGIYYEMRRKKE
jgi:glycosyltransferase involved in cell wall biosynthesis